MSMKIFKVLSIGMVCIAMAGPLQASQCPDIKTDSEECDLPTFKNTNGHQLNADKSTKESNDLKNQSEEKRADFSPCWEHFKRVHGIYY